MDLDAAYELLRHYENRMAEYENHIAIAKRANCPKLAEAHYKTANRIFTGLSATRNCLEDNGYAWLGA